MRIALIVAGNPLTSATDMSSQPAQLARALAGQGHRVTIYARKDGTAARTGILGRGVSVEFIAAGPAKPLAAEQAARHMPLLAAELIGRWIADRPDVVHAFGWVAGLAALGAVRELDIPVVQSFGSLAVAENRQPGSGVLASRLRLETLIARKAAAVLAISSAEAADLAKMGVRRPAIKIVPCGVDTSQFSPEGKTQARAKQVRLVALTDAEHASGLTAILHATAQLPQAELVIAGGPDSRHLPRSGPFRALAQLATELRIRGRVKFAGELAPPELAALLRSADVLVERGRLRARRDRRDPGHGVRHSRDRVGRRRPGRCRDRRHHRPADRTAAPGHAGQPAAPAAGHPGTAARLRHRRRGPRQVPVLLGAHRQGDRGGVRALPAGLRGAG